MVVVLKNDKASQEANEIAGRFEKIYGWDASMITISDDGKTIDMYSFDESSPPKEFEGMQVGKHI